MINEPKPQKSSKFLSKKNDNQRVFEKSEKTKKQKNVFSENRPEIFGDNNQSKIFKNACFLFKKHHFFGRTNMQKTRFCFVFSLCALHLVQVRLSTLRIIAIVSVLHFVARLNSQQSDHYCHFRTRAFPLMNNNVISHKSHAQCHDIVLKCR